MEQAHKTIDCSDRWHVYSLKKTIAELDALRSNIANLN